MKTLRRKIRQEVRLQSEPGFPEPKGMHYLLHLQQLHEKLKPKVYFEIGTESGASLSFASCTSIAVDPQFQLEADVSRNKPELHQYQGTSDDFFASRMLDRLDLRIDLAFLDGMHLFEFLLRDFMNTEKRMSPGGLITMHDCVPKNFISAARDWDKAQTGFWTGDVWKIVPILREHRPDLRVEVLDAPPTGLVCVSGLDPGNRILDDNYDKIVAQYLNVSLQDHTLDRLGQVLDMKPAAAITLPAISPPPKAAEPRTNWRAIRRYYDWQTPKAPAAGHRRIAIKTFVGRRKSSESTGDFHLARGLADGFMALGHSVRIDSMKDWDTGADEADLDLLLYGEGDYVPPSANPFLVWVLYPGRETFTLPASFKQAAHIFIASEQGAAIAAKTFGKGRTSALLQGFDDKVMTPDPVTGRDGLVFVGNNHFSAFSNRATVEYAVATSTDIRLWGAGWRRHEASKHLQGQTFPNTELGALYRSARAVLCDHMPVMRANGFISNRIFDALACGAPLICDDVSGLPAEFAPFVKTCRSAEDFRKAVAEVNAETAAEAERRIAFAREIRDLHSLRRRAEQIMAVALQIPARTKEV